MSFLITVVVPVLNRQKNVAPFLNSFLANTPKDRAEVLFVTSNSCQDEINEIKKFEGPIHIGIAPDEVLSWAKRINWGINYSENNTKLDSPSTWVLCAADDVVFHPNWLEEAEKAAKDFNGVIATNDLGSHAVMVGQHATHPLVSRKYVKEQGTVDEAGKFLHEGYRHNYVDLELVATAKKRNAFKAALDCKVEHFHPSWKKAEWDNVYQIGQDHLNQDRQLWVNRSNKFNLKA